MKIYTLLENTACRTDLRAEHGLSLLIETGGQRILFDTGASPAFAGNAEALGIDLNTVDIAILSHGHYDHGGGIARFLEINKHAPVWLSRHAFEPHFNAAGKDIGLSPALTGNPRFRTAPAEVLELAPGISLHPARLLPTTYPNVLVSSNTGIAVHVKNGLDTGHAILGAYIHLYTPWAVA